MKVEVHVHKLMDDPDFPYPWKWHLEVDTPYGHLSDEGLCATEEGCALDAEGHVLKWIADRKVASATHHVILLNIEDGGEDE